MVAKHEGKLQVQSQGGANVGAAKAAAGTSGQGAATRGYKQQKGRRVARQGLRGRAYNEACAAVESPWDVNS